MLWCPQLLVMNDRDMAAWANAHDNRWHGLFRSTEPCPRQDNETEKNKFINLWREINLNRKCCAGFYMHWWDTDRGKEVVRAFEPDHMLALGCSNRLKKVTLCSRAISSYRFMHVLCVNNTTGGVNDTRLPVPQRYSVVFFDDEIRIDEVFVFWSFHQICWHWEKCRVSPFRFFELAFLCMLSRLRGVTAIRLFPMYFWHVRYFADSP